MSRRKVVKLGMGLVVGVVSVYLLVVANADTAGPALADSTKAVACQLNLAAVSAAAGEVAVCSSSGQDTCEHTKTSPATAAQYATDLAEFVESGQAKEVRVVIREGDNVEEEVIVIPPDEDRDAYVGRKERFEAMWTEKIDRLLAYVPGKIVTVNVELNNQLRLEEHVVDFGRDPVTTETARATRSQRTEEGIEAAASGSKETNDSPFATGKNESKQSQEVVEENEETIKSVVSRSEINRAEAPLIPRRVSVSIALPSSYIADVWHHRNAVAEETAAAQPDSAAIEKIRRQVIGQIEQAVATLLPSDSIDGGPMPPVNVSVFEDLGTRAAFAPAGQRPPARDTVAERNSKSRVR